MSSDSVIDSQHATGPHNTDDPAYQRAYKACDVCRKRKSRCILFPGTATCQRCRRESRACVFSEHRYKSKAGRQSQRQDRGSHSITSPSLSWRAQTHGAPNLPGPSPSSVGLADSVVHTVVSSGNDARDLMFSAVREDNAGAAEPFRYAVSNNVRGSAGVGPEQTLSAPEAWNACRWIMQGWLSASEAIDLVDFFFDTIAPLSPVPTNTFRSHKSHYSLVTDEPFLCCTILMIASQLTPLPGPGGGTRSAYLHDRLWTHIQHLLLRLVLGQEKESKGKLRSLGTLEGLLLLTEWHPRAVAFPPPMDGWDSSLVMNSGQDGSQLPTVSAEQVRGRWRHDVVRPARRFDQMSWMLLGNAMTLACDLGILDNETNLPPTSAFTELQTQERAKRLCSLLFVYSEQLSLQTGSSPLVPHSLQHLMMSPPTGDTASGIAATKQDRVALVAWAELTKLARAIKEALFQPHHQFQHLVSTGRYLTLVEHFKPNLSQWESRHIAADANNGLSPLSRQILRIEYLYVRTHLCSTGMQALLERQSASAGTIDTYQAFSAGMHGNADHQLVQDVIDGSIEILHIATHLHQPGALRYASSRTLQRIVSASMFLLKAMSLSVSAAKLNLALSTLADTIAALRQNAMDDIQLSARYADLLEICVEGLREKFVRYGSGGQQWGESSGPIEPTQRQDGVTQPTGAIDPFVDSDGLEMDWLRLPVDPSLFAAEQIDPYNFSWLDENTLDFLQTLDQWPSAS